MPNKDIDMAVTIFDNSGTNERTNERTEVVYRSGASSKRFKDKA